jgi:hypothetical protein
VIVGQDNQELPAADTLPSTQLDPATVGHLAWSDDASLITGTLKPTTGTLSFALGVAAAARANGATLTVTVEVATVGATLTAGQNLLGLYRSDNTTLTRLGVSADQGAAWLTTGIKTTTLTLATAINPGDLLYLALLTAGTTTPTFRAAPAATLINAGTVKRRGTVVGTTLPATLTLASVVAATAVPGILAT